ncbi:uncharacterized protein LOC127284581 [Leptopilina boulardi]|uniref:uncharacterized protein LOC127284581 n=1 Tax=Leptopilina boulardi TaxID=63433 RepID=UPI0021F63563|nr:uncharacterized protein LOC127284581 [Leptopilina boulardi]
MKIEQDIMLKKLIEPMVTIPENSELFIQRQEQSFMIEQNSGLLNSTIFIPEELQRLNCAIPQLIYLPPVMEIPPSTCAYCQHLNNFNQTMPNVQYVNFRALPSLDKYCADLPFTDMLTFQYFYNLGIEYSEGFYANAANCRANYNNRYKKGRKFKKYFKNSTFNRNF